MRRVGSSSGDVFFFAKDKSGVSHTMTIGEMHGDEAYGMISCLELSDVLITMNYLSCASQHWNMRIIFS